MDGVGEVYGIHSNFLWVAWEKYLKYTANPCEWHGGSIQNTLQIPVGGMGKVYRIRSESLGVALEKYVKYTIHPYGVCRTSTQNTKQIPVGGVGEIQNTQQWQHGEVCRIHSKSLWVAWEKYTIVYSKSLWA